jgi:hypothetical protein
MIADMTLIQGAISSLKTATDIAKGLLHLQSLAEVQGKVIELQSAILAAQSSALAAQSEQSAVIQRVRDLEEEIARVKAWEETKQRYQLIAPWTGFYVYALKKSCKESEPPHWICARCYEDGMKSLLQDIDKFDRRLVHVTLCPRCKFEIENNRYGPPDRHYV